MMKIFKICVFITNGKVFHDKFPAIKDINLKSLEKLFAIKKFYQERNTELINLLQKHTRELKEEFPDICVADILSYSIEQNEWYVPQMDEHQIFKHYACQEIQKTLEYILGGDELQSHISEQIQEYAKLKSGVLGNPEYQAKRKELADRILSANSIFIFGGEVGSLYYSMKFWELDKTLHEALMRGTNFYTVSAGSIILCNKIIMYNDFPGRDGERQYHFEFFDHGFGLVTRIKLFPHCHDRIQTDDPDNLAYLAHRFEGRVCVGLNENSFLLLDAHYGEDGRLHPRYQSMGEKDGVYVFDPSGQKIQVEKGESLLVPGTIAWEEHHRENETTPSMKQKYTGDTLWGSKKRR